MSSRVNPYAIDPNLAQGFSNLTQALIGNSGTDRDMSAVRANDALANRRNQETENLLQKNQILDALNQSVGNVSLSEPIQNALALALTGQNLFTPQDAQMTDEYFEAGEAMEASNLGIESPADVATPLGQFRQGDPVLSDLARTFFGDLTYQPNQLSSAFTNLGTSNQENARNNELVDIILNGTPEQAERAMMAYRGEGKYNLPGLAGQEIDKTLASKEKQNKYEVDQTVLASKYQDDLRYGIGGSEDRLQAVRNSWERYKAGVEDARKKYEIDEDNKVAVKKFEKEQEVIKYKFDNRTIEIQVGKDGRAYIDPTTAQKMVEQGKQPNFDEETGLFYLDGQKSPEKIKKIEVGDKDVWMDEATAKIFGVKANAEGKFIIKGKPKSDKKAGSGGGGSGSNAAEIEKTKAFSDEYSLTIGMDKQLPNYNKLPQTTKGLLKSVVAGIIATEGDKENNTLSKAQLIEQIIPATVGQGFTLITKGVRNFSVPTFLISNPNERPTEEELRIDFGYSKVQAQAILNYIEANQ